MDGGGGGRGADGGGLDCSSRVSAKLEPLNVAGRTSWWIADAGSILTEPTTPPQLEGTTSSASSTGIFTARMPTHAHMPSIRGLGRHARYTSTCTVPIYMSMIIREPCHRLGEFDLPAARLMLDHARACGFVSRLGTDAARDMMSKEALHSGPGTGRVSCYAPQLRLRLSESPSPAGSARPLLH